jgi:hypothetical protein
VARTPKPYLYRGWYCTGVYGIVNHKLCPESEGPAEAAKQLGLWMAMIEDKRRLAGCDNAHKVLAINPATVTVAAALDEFMKLTRSQICHNTLRGYVARLRPFRSRFLNRPVSSLREGDGVEFKEFLMTRKEWKKGNTIVKGLGNAWVNRCLTSARSFLKWCAQPQRRYCIGDPWVALGRLEERPRERLLTDDEFQILLKTPKDRPSGTCWSSCATPPAAQARPAPPTGTWSTGTATSWSSPASTARANVSPRPPCRGAYPSCPR